MESLYILTSSAFFLWLIRNIFYWVGVWQKNDYSITSFAINLKNEILKRSIHEHLLLVYKLILLALFFYVASADNFLLYYQQLISLAYFIEFFIVLKEIYRNELKKPVLTFRSIIIIAFSLLNSFLIFSVPLVDRFLWLMIVDLTLVLFLGFFVFVIQFPVEIYVDIQTGKALQKLKKHKNLLTIIVIGNYGVRETKENIAHILSKEYNILKLGESENSVLGIANALSRKLKNDTNLLITGIKAYSQDEIRLICKILSPQILIITGVNSNKSYASEMINALPKNAITLFNGRDKNSYWLYSTTKKNKVLYNYLTIPANITINTRNNHSITAYNILQKANSVSFDVAMNGNSMHLAVNEIKEHKIEHILPSIFLANYLGIKKMAIKKAISRLNT
jgi:hypothetical protein